VSELEIEEGGRGNGGGVESEGENTSFCDMYQNETKSDKCTHRKKGTEGVRRERRTT
jgi:hypothetical protein